MKRSTGSARIKFEVLDHETRSVSTTAATEDVRDDLSVDVFEDKSSALKLMFDPDHAQEEHILNEQFL